MSGTLQICRRTELGGRRCNQKRVDIYCYSFASAVSAVPSCLRETILPAVLLTYVRALTNWRTFPTRKGGSELKTATYE
jgi:hypothetical protein